MRIEARDLIFSMHDRSLVQNVSLRVKPGEVLGLVGPNGSGKSTLLRLLAGLMRPTAGQVLLSGVPISRLGRRKIAQQIAIVEQQANTSERITARAVVELGRTPWLSSLRPWRDEDTRQVDMALKTVGMDGLAHRDWATLSGGEKQRLHIARALAQKPEVLLLDEPTNHLDINHQLSILGCIRSLNVTTVVALHDLNQAMSCDQVIVMSEGKVVAQGKPEEALTPNILLRTFGVSVRWLRHAEIPSPILSFYLP